MELLPGPALRSSSADSLEAMQFHRMTQCAETGQLLPRARRFSDSGDLSNPNMSLPIHQGHINYSLPRPSTDSVITTTPNHKAMATPTIEITPTLTPPGEHYLSQYGPIPIKKFGQQIGSSEPTHTSQPMEEREASLPTPPTTPRTSFTLNETRDSQIWRQVNSGFAILRPGSLDSAASLEAQSSTHSRDSSSDSQGEKRRGGKLQKKRPSEEMDGKWSFEYGRSK